MSRSIDVDREIPVSEDRRTGAEPRPEKTHAMADLRVRLVERIDRAALNQPVISEFITRLEKDGVAVLPSLQSSGKWNGVSYRFEDTTFNGSNLGRAYSARGLQVKKGIDYEPERDRATLAAAAERGGIRRDVDNRGDFRTRALDTGLTASQLETLADIGKFRIIAATDLMKYRYGGNDGKFERELRHLAERGLLERRVITHGRKPRTEAVVVLKAAGRNLLRRENSKRNGAVAQQFYAGFVKPSEVAHDVGIYRMYQHEAAQIEREGGTIRRVVLDFEFKKRVFGELNKIHEVGDAPRRKVEIAGANGLSVVEGRVVLPDLRIEYETRDQELEKVDLELTTGHYKESQIAAKRAAGMKLYSPDSNLGSPAHYDPEIVSGLVSM